MSLKVTGIILKQKKLGDFDILAMIFSREQGKLAVVGKKAKKKPDLCAKLELFNENCFILSQGENFNNIYQADNLRIFKHLRGDYNLFQAAANFAKIIDSITLIGQQNESLYNLFVKYLSILDNIPNNSTITGIIKNFYKDLLKTEGLWQEQYENLTAKQYQVIVKAYAGEKIGRTA